MKNLDIKVNAFLSASSYISRRLIGCEFKPLDQASYRSEVIVEEGMINAITPFYWESQLPRIIGAISYGAKQVIIEDLNRRFFHFKPVIAYWLRNAVLFDGSIYCGGYRHELRSIYLNKPRIGFNFSGVVGEMNEAAMISTVAGSTWWGHWMADELPLQMISEKILPPVSFGRPFHYDELAYRCHLGVSNPIKYDIAHFKSLLLVDEFAQNPSKTRRYQVLRDRMKNKLSLGHKRIYLRRGASGNKRNLINELAVMKRLESEGFVTIDISTSSTEAIVSACLGAEVVVSIEGSHFTPLLYMMREFGVMIVLNPPNRVLTTNPDIGVFCGLSSAMFICETTDSGDPSTDFYADPDELCWFIDDAIAYGSRNAGRLEGFLDKVLKMDKTGLFK